MAKAGADIVVCHLGLTTGGAIGAETAVTLKDCVPRIDAWAAAARAVNPRRHRALPRRAHRPPGGRALHPAPVPAVPRLLRRLQHGAAAHRGGADGDDPKVQAHPATEETQGGPA